MSSLHGGSFENTLTIPLPKRCGATGGGGPQEQDPAEQRGRSHQQMEGDQLHIRSSLTFDSVIKAWSNKGDKI